tara:strand:- start:536 stop:1477 length:942 start_codon:yes stop_codon:yes gene_type:complete
VLEHRPAQLVPDDLESKDFIDAYNSFYFEAPPSAANRRELSRWRQRSRGLQQLMEDIRWHRAAARHLLPSQAAAYAEHAHISIGTVDHVAWGKYIIFIIDRLGLEKLHAWLRRMRLEVTEGLRQHDLVQTPYGGGRVVGVGGGTTTVALPWGTAHLRTQVRWDPLQAFDDAPVLNFRGARLKGTRFLLARRGEALAPLRPRVLVGLNWVGGGAGDQLFTMDARWGVACMQSNCNSGSTCLNAVHVHMIDRSRDTTELRPVGQPNATLICSACRSAIYCSQECFARHYAAHRKYCRWVRERRKGDSPQPLPGDK